jgi:hypothetical protein
MDTLRFAAGYLYNFFCNGSVFKADEHDINFFLV